MVEEEMIAMVEEKMIAMEAMMVLQTGMLKKCLNKSMIKSMDYSKN
jgi:hypothetical protein